MKKVAFIVNPKAGVRKKIDVQELIRSNFSKDIQFEILLWNDKNNFEKIKQKILQENFTISVAVGGDGTVNQVAKTIQHTNIVLGIVPLGSGNGLARSLGIPLNPIDALKRIETGSIRTIDSGLINNQSFFCTSGVGFDALIGNLFATSSKRGFWTYAKIIFRQLFGYKAQQYSLTMNGNTITRTAFLITFANAGQYGNDFYIAPAAKMDDGLLHVAVMRPFPLIMAPSLALKIIRRKAESSAYIETFSASEIKLVRSQAGAIHYDGEPDIMPQEIMIKVVPQSLKVIC